MKASIERRMAQAEVVIDGERFNGVGAVIGKADTESLVMMLVSMTVSVLFDFLL